PRPWARPPRARSRTPARRRKRMSTRTSSAALLALLAACAESGAADGENEAARVDAGGTTIDCALDGAAAFAESCWYERVERGGERLLVIHHPDGGFRRFVPAGEGHGLMTADGAEEAMVATDRAAQFTIIQVGNDT